MRPLPSAGEARWESRAAEASEIGDGPHTRAPRNAHQGRARGVEHLWPSASRFRLRSTRRDDEDCGACTRDGVGVRRKLTRLERRINKQKKRRFRKLATHQLGMTALRLELRGFAGHRGGSNGEFLSRGSSQGGRNMRCETRAYAGPRRSPPTRRTKRRPRMDIFSPISVPHASPLGRLARARKIGRARAMRPAIGP